VSLPNRPPLKLFNSFEPLETEPIEEMVNRLTTLPRISNQIASMSIEDAPKETNLGDEMTLKATPSTSQRLVAEDLGLDLTDEEWNPTSEKTFEELVPEQYRDFRDVFEKSTSERLPVRKPWDHAIDLLPGATLPVSKLYAHSPAEQKQLDDFLDEQLRKGYIRPSKSPTAAPVFFVNKKGGGLRLCQDYRKLNEITIKNRYPLPLVSELIDKLKKAKYFTKIDLRWGYNNVRIREGDEWKAAFRTYRGLFEPLVMFFGMCNSPGTFQNMMNDIFWDLLFTLCILLDDLLIFSETLEEHQQTVREVLKRLRENDLFAKAEKCEFEKMEVEYLGLLVSQGCVRMDPV
jgi:hypothetical protein